MVPHWSAASTLCVSSSIGSKSGASNPGGKVRLSSFFGLGLMLGSRFGHQASGIGVPSDGTGSARKMEFHQLAACARVGHPGKPSTGIGTKLVCREMMK